MDRSGEELSVQYENRLTLLEACDRAGFYCYHLAEHHQTPLGLASSPSVFLAAAAQRTRTLRLGALVFTLSVYHPLRILDEVCMLDHLSKGRLDLGLGARHFSQSRSVSMASMRRNRRGSIREVAAILQQGLISQVINHQGKHFTFRDVPVELSPLQSTRFPCGTALCMPRAPTARRRTAKMLCATARRQ